MINLSIIVSPIMPFVTEKIYCNLTSNVSVHLADWPKIVDKKIDTALLDDMNTIRRIAEIGHRARKDLKIKVRQPLAQATIMVPKELKFQKAININEYTKLMCDELNIKQCYLKEKASGDIELSYDIKLTEQLILEGKLRDLIRMIQEERKKLGVKQDQAIDIVIPKEFIIYKQQIQKKVLTRNISQGSRLKVSL